MEKHGHSPASGPAFPHLSSRAGLEPPNQIPAPHASVCAPPSCRPVAAGDAGSCSQSLAAVSAMTAPPGAPPSRLQAHLLRPLLPDCPLPRSSQGPAFSSVQFSRSVVSDSLRPHGLQHARPPCPSPILGIRNYIKVHNYIMYM